MSKKAATKFVEVTKAAIEHAAAPPVQFHCEHCSALLAVPVGDWVCQSCTMLNAEAASKCIACTQDKSNQKCLCGVCRNSTSIPTRNIVDSIRTKGREIHQSARKVYFDLRKVAFVTCPRCSAHLPLAPDNNAPPVPNPSESSAAPAQNQPPARVFVECNECSLTMEVDLTQSAVPAEEMQAMPLQQQQGYMSQEVSQQPAQPSVQSP